MPDAAISRHDITNLSSWKITGGMLLRDCTISKPYLAIVYAAIGGALLQASVHYYLSFFRFGGKD